MFFSRFQKTLTGIEISDSSIKVAQIVRDKRGWRVTGFAGAPLPEETLKLSFKTENVNDPEAFAETIKRALAMVGGSASRVGLSLPNEVVKVSLQNYSDLPQGREQTEKMIAWCIRSTLPFPVEQAKVSYTLLDRSSVGDRRVLASLVHRDVVREYEMNMRGLKLEPQVIRPSAINHYNFYHERIPRSGLIAFMGLFERYTTLFVFEEGVLLFYHGLKKGYSDLHFFQDVEMMIALYQNENPGKGIDKLFYASQVGFHADLDQGLRSLTATAVSSLPEREMITVDSSLNGKRGVVELYPFAAAIGAAQSLAG
jgi:Tfp pilus assembly PilM family ATPase